MKHQTTSTPSNHRSIWLVSVIAAFALAVCAFASLALSPQLSLATDSSSTPASSSSTNSTMVESGSTTSDSSASTSSTESASGSAGQPSEITDRITTSTPPVAAAPANATENDSTANADENDGTTDGTTTVPGTTPATQTTVSDTRPELTLDQSSASFISRSRTITYTINQMVSSDVNSLVITDTLEGVMGFVSTNENVSVIWNGASIAADVQIDGQNLTVTIQDATGLRGHAVTVSFQAKVLEGVDITPYANGTNIATIPNSAYATLYGDTERTLQSDPKEVKVSLGGTTGSTGTTTATTTTSTRATATTATSSSTVGKATAQTGDSPLLPMTVGVLGLLSLAGAVVALRRQASTN